jgi:hypothetical protein
MPMPIPAFALVLRPGLFEGMDGLVSAGRLGLLAAVGSFDGDDVVTVAAAAQVLSYRFANDET